MSSTIPPELVERRVCDLWGLQPEALRDTTGNRQHPRISAAKALLIAALYEQAWSMRQIGRYLGMADHTSVKYSLDKKAVDEGLLKQVLRPVEVLPNGDVA